LKSEWRDGGPIVAGTLFEVVPIDLSATFREERRSLFKADPPGYYH
jgi:hypothetical protein